MVSLALKALQLTNPFLCLSVLACDEWTECLNIYRLNIPTLCYFERCLYSVPLL